MGNLLTIKELGKYLKISESTVYKLSIIGEIRGFKIGKSWRFDMSDIVACIDKKREEAKHYSKDSNFK